MFARFAADGVVVATTSGSTAYSYSAGGPIVSPGVDALVVVPVAPHGSFRSPLILPCGDGLSIDVMASSAPVVAEVDGQARVQLMAGSSADLELGTCAVTLVRDPDDTFYDRVRRKLGVIDPPELIGRDLPLVARLTVRTRDQTYDRGETMKAVRFNRYGGPEVLEIVDVPRPVPSAGQVLVRMKAAGLNPGESKIRQGLLHTRSPATFPSGEGSDLAGVVAEVAPDIEGVAVGDEVVGFTDQRASHAELVLVEVGNLTPKPAGVPWEVAGSLFVAGTTAYATVHAVAAGTGDTIVVAGAAGGVGGTTCSWRG